MKRSSAACLSNTQPDGAVCSSAPVKHHSLIQCEQQPVVQLVLNLFSGLKTSPLLLLDLWAPQCFWTQTCNSISFTRSELWGYEVHAEVPKPEVPLTSSRGFSSDSPFIGTLQGGGFRFTSVGQLKGNGSSGESWDDESVFTPCLCYLCQPWPRTEPGPFSVSFACSPCACRFPSTV